MRHFQPSQFLYPLFLIVIGLSANQCTDSSSPELLPVEEGYKPDQPIEFPHDIHAGKLKIDCKYCHNSANAGDKEGIQAADICMKCHKQTDGNFKGEN